ncbi:unnamed protein product [Linum trigynum]|uniref:Ubiquitin-like domain-containing protein n=1 Tax=Linum trigynum TaxID=586398 RepID=A0AAV2FYD1_9ROSI
MIKSKRPSNGYGKVKHEPIISSTAKEDEADVEWEMRPGGMLVQKRTEKNEAPAHNLRVRIAYGALRYEISVNSQATFGELKKLVTAETGLEPGEQRVAFRGKERQNGEYLDICGVRDRSKVVVTEDPASIERRYIQMRKSAAVHKSLRAISDISMEIDKLAEQVGAMEKSVASGNRVPELQITTLIEVLMRQAVKLDAMAAEGEASSRKIIQSKRVQKCVEALDMVKMSNGKVEKPPAPAPVVVATTKWEIFDPPDLNPPPPAASSWELFD